MEKFSSRLHISHQPCRCPRIGIIPLIPIDKALPSRNPRHSRPAPPENDVVLPVEEISRVPRIQIHGLESSVWCDGCRSPLPEASHVSLTAEIGGSGHGSGMPVGKADVCAIQVDEEVVRIGTQATISRFCLRSCCCFRRAGGVSIAVLWWGFLNTIVD